MMRLFVNIFVTNCKANKQSSSREPEAGMRRRKRTQNKCTYNSISWS